MSFSWFFRNEVVKAFTIACQHTVCQQILISQSIIPISEVEALEHLWRHMVAEVKISS